MIDCSVSIVNYNTKDALEKGIRSILDFTKGVSLEVIVVDNASADGSVENVREKFPSVKIIQNKENLYFTKACNQGLAASQGRYALTFNPDCYIDDNSIGLMVQFMDKNPDVGACGPTFLNTDGTVQSRGHGFPSLLWPYFQLFFINTLFPRNPVREAREVREEKVQEIDAFGGGGILVRKEILEKVGVLDEGFLSYFEDTDWCKRIRAAGWKIVHLPDRHFFHVGGEATVKVNKKKFDRILYTSMLYYYRKHYGIFVSWTLKILLYGFHYPALKVVRSLQSLTAGQKKAVLQV